MPELSFDFYWVDSERIRGPELSATWASLRITVGDAVITRILDERAKTVRDRVYVPLYPLAEWLATNWWFLTNEYQNPDRQGNPEFRRRHSLSLNREGYAFPDLEVVSSGDRTRLAWRSYAPQWTRVEFLNQGQVWVDKLEFRQACTELIDGVVRRLVSGGIEDTLLQEEWAAIQDTEQDGEELSFCEVAAGLGWDPYDLDVSQRDDVLQLANDLGELLEEAVQAVNPACLREQSSAIASAINDARHGGSHPLRLNTLSGESGWRSTDALPWSVGYDWARLLRLELDLDGQPLATMGALAAAIGEDEHLLHEATRPVDLLAKAPLVDGLVTIDHDQSASFAFRQLNEQGRRFGFCRALAEVLMSHGSGALLTRAHSERQQRNRAFAAEFLAPSRSLREKVRQPVVYSEDVDELAEEFGVSSFVVKHQIENHQIAQLSESTII